MTRLSKQARKRSQSPKRPKLRGKPTGPKKDKLEMGYKEKTNSISGAFAATCYIPKIKTL